MLTKGQKIKAKREELGISQTDLAAKIGVSKQTLYKYENDIITNIPSDKIEALGKELNMSASYIMGWTDKMLNYWDKHIDSYYDINYINHEIDPRIRSYLLVNNEEEPKLEILESGIEDVFEDKPSREISFDEKEMKEAFHIADDDELGNKRIEIAKLIGELNVESLKKLIDYAKYIKSQE